MDSSCCLQVLPVKLFCAWAHTRCAPSFSSFFSINPPFFFLFLVFEGPRRRGVE